LQSYPGRERVLDQLGIIRRQAVLGLQDGCRARLQVIFRRFDFPDELRRQRGGPLDTELFPNWWCGWVARSVSARTGGRRLSAWPNRNADICGLVTCRLVVYEIRGVEIILAGDPHHCE